VADPHSVNIEAEEGVLAPLFPLCVIVVGRNPFDFNSLVGILERYFEPDGLYVIRR